MDNKKITLATIKSFINNEMKNDKLYIASLSSFDGMVDCVMPSDDKNFKKAVKSERNSENDLGVAGAWFVKGSRDSFETFENDEFKGFEVYNCCGSFILATTK